MNEHPTLRDISLNITEEEYRADGTIHYSDVAAFERKGFHEIPHMGEKKESTSLLFGSIVDTMLTDGMDAFENQYHVASMPNLPDNIAKVVKGLFDAYHETATVLDEVPDLAILATLDRIDYGTGWRAATRIGKVRIPAANEYYRQLTLAQNKIVITDEMYNQALASVSALKESPATSALFEADNPFKGTEHFYQLKFRALVNPNNIEDIVGTYGMSTEEELSYRAKGYVPFTVMMDEAMVFHNTKVVLPIDLKTSSHFEDEFFKSFVDWNYHIQARTYYKVLEANMKRSEYYKDFTLLDYVFVVVNKNSLIPLVWRYSDTQKRGTLVYGKNKNIIMRDPLVLGCELWKYRQQQPVVPYGISTDTPNELVDYLNTL